MRRSYFSVRDIWRSPALQVSLVVLALLIISLLLFYLRGSRRASRVLFFPESSFGRSFNERRGEQVDRLFAEVRRLPLRGSTEEDIRLLVEDLMLGPVDPMHVRLVPKETRLIGLICKRGALYVNLSAGVLADDVESELPLQRKLQGVANAILFNFPSLRRVHLFIEGQVPDFRSTGRAAAGGASRDFHAGLSYDPTILD